MNGPGMTRWTLLLVAPMLLFGVCSRASAALLCVEQNGALHVREVCQKKEVQLDLATLDDRAAFVTGRIQSNGLGSYAGAPSGASNGADGFRTLAPSVDRTASNLAVELEGVATADVIVALTPFVGGLKTGSFLLCTVPAGQTTCTSGSSTLPIPAASSLNIEVFALSTPVCEPSCPTAPSVRFGYEVR